MELINSTSLKVLVHESCVAGTERTSCTGKSRFLISCDPQQVDIEKPEDSSAPLLPGLA